jgi:hypothetical protein
MSVVQKVNKRANFQNIIHVNQKQENSDKSVVLSVACQCLIILDRQIKWFLSNKYKIIKI